MVKGTAIAGIGNTKFTDGSDGRPGLDLALEAIIAAVEDAGLEVNDIDGLIKYNIDPSASHEMLISNLGLDKLSFGVETPSGGSGSCSTAQLAAMAVATGVAETVVCYRCFTRDDYGPALRHNPAWLFARLTGVGSFVRPYGWGLISEHFALQARRHMEEFGSTEADLGAIVSAFANHGANNPNALRGNPVSVEEYLDTPYLNAPLRELDCFVNPSAGACAFVVTSAERAASLKQKPAHISGAVTAAADGFPPNWEMYSMRQGPIIDSAANVVAGRLWDQTGIKASDIDVAEIYDCYSYTVVSQLEGYGFCKTGEGGDFVQGGRIEVGGEIPVNTHGGHLAEAYIHGFSHILEGVRQIRGESTTQVDGAETVLVTGGPGSTSSAVILTKEQL
jgi:acetyl-CoA acetyltransferase